MKPATTINDFPQLQPGDILLYGGRDLVSRLIQFRTWSDVSHIASTGPPPRGGGNSFSVNPCGASPQYLNCESLRCFECLYACDVWSSRHYQLVLRWLRHASAEGGFRITLPLAG